MEASPISLLPGLPWMGLGPVTGGMGWPRSVSVDQQDLDATGFCVVAGAGGLLGFAQDDALRGDALGDECFAHAKGATFGQITVEVDVAGGVVVAGQQDTTALDGLQGLDHGGNGLLSVSRK